MRIVCVRHVFVSRRTSFCVATAVGPTTRSSRMCADVYVRSAQNTVAKPASPIGASRDALMGAVASANTAPSRAT